MVAFLLGVRIGGVYWGAAIGLVLAAVVLVRAIGRKHLHLFDVIGTVYFGALLVLLAVLHPADISTWGRYAQAVAMDRRPDRLRLHPDREALYRGLRPRTSAAAGMEQSTFSRLQPQDLSGLWPGLPRGHHVADRGRFGRLASVRASTSGSLWRFTHGLAPHPEVSE